MTFRTEFGLTLTVDGASDEELMRGLRADIALLDAAGVTPCQAVEAHFNREGWAEAGYDEASKPTAAEMNTANLWDAACAAAVNACRAGWPTSPTVATLDLS